MPNAQSIEDSAFVQSLNTKRVDLSRFATPAIAARFWDQVQKTDHCWIWKGSTRKGYGKFHPVSGVTVSAPRFAYSLQYGVDPGLAYVCHKCDQALCSRPEHLFLGTPLENMADKKAKGRSRFGRHHGEANARARLTAADVEAIRVR